MPRITRRRRTATESGKLKALSGIPDAPVPETLDPGRMKALTPGRVTSYQRKVLAHFTPYLEIPFFQSMAKLINAGDKDAMELYAKVSKKIADKNGIQVNTTVKANSDNQTDNRKIEQHNYSSVEQIARELHAGRSQAGQLGPVATPTREKPEVEEDDDEEE